MKNLIFILLCAGAGIAEASPFVVSDPTAAVVTHCGVVLDEFSKVDVTVAKDASGAYCKFDLAGVSKGAHTIKATFVNVDPVWGRSESALSTPFVFTKPDAIIVDAPSGMRIVP